MANGQQFASCPTDSYVQDVYENPLYERYLSKYDVTFYHLSLEVSNVSTYIEGYTTVQLEVLLPMDTLVLQLIDALEVSDIEVNTVPVSSFIHKDDALYIPCDCSSGEMVEVTVYYSGEASQDRGFFAGITSAFDNTNEQWVTYTLSEPQNARDWFPVKQVLQDKADSVWVDITCDRSLMAGSNGLLEGIVVKTGGKHTFKWRSRYPIAYYLISFAVADYLDYSFNASLSQPGDSVLVQNYIYNDEEYFQNWKDRIDKTGELISLFSKLVIDYPFKEEKYGHCVAPMGGGMEHQTMTTLANFNFNLVAHELAHQWFGDNVTCGNWQDIWINEGFASYFEYIALQNLVDQESADNWLEFAKNLAFAETGSVYVPEEEAEDEYRVFDNGLSYKKGAVLLHMIRYILDDDQLFFNVLKEYSEKYTDDLATAVEFREVLDSLSGQDFSCFFEQWYYGKGYPHFYLSWYSKNDTLYLQSLQESSVSETPLFKTPFDIGINTSSGVELVRLFQDQQEQFFALAVNGTVSSITFDPNRQLLAKGSVISALAFDKRILMGPNPFTDKLLLRFFQQTRFDQANVYNISGRLMVSSEITSNPFELELSSLPQGTYILVLNGESGTFMDKIVKR